MSLDTRSESKNVDSKVAYENLALCYGNWDFFSTGLRAFLIIPPRIAKKVESFCSKLKLGDTKQTLKP